MADRIIFVCTLALAALYFWGTAQIPTISLGDPLGPKAFPKLLGIGLLITAALLFIEIWSARKTQPKEENRAPLRNYGHLVVFGAVVLWTFIYFAVFVPLGYVLSTIIYLLVLTAYFNRGKWVTNILTSVLYCLLMYSLFTKILGVSLPRGVLSF